VEDVKCLKSHSWVSSPEYKKVEEDKSESEPSYDMKKIKCHNNDRDIDIAHIVEQNISVIYLFVIITSVMDIMTKCVKKQILQWSSDFRKSHLSTLNNPSTVMQISNRRKTTRGLFYLSFFVSLNTLSPFVLNRSPTDVATADPTTRACAAQVSTHKGLCVTAPSHQTPLLKAQPHQKRLGKNVPGKTNH